MNMRTLAGLLAARFRGAFRVPLLSAVTALAGTLLLPGHVAAQTVQRGTLTLVASANPLGQTVTISAVNLSKAFVLVTGNRDSGTGCSGALNVSAQLISSTQLKIYWSALCTDYPRIEWQVVELP